MARHPEPAHDAPPDEPPAEGAGGVADAQWERVRALAATVARLEELEAQDGLDEDGEARLARARIRAARAAERALLADHIADQLADIRAPRERRP